MCMASDVDSWCISYQNTNQIKYKDDLGSPLRRGIFLFASTSYIYTLREES